MLSSIPAGTVPADLDPSDSDFSSRVDFALWERELARVGYCANPIHLRGAIEHVDKQTGEVRQVFSTEDRPGNTLTVRCGSRLASKCPACAWLYQQDAYHLLKAGMAGGKGLPASVAAHPRVFVTLTAPSFGPVHTRVVEHGQVQHCHPRDGHKGMCPHGRRLDCRLQHREDDPRLGEPLCAACYRYEDAVLWNAHAPELWRRTRNYVYRELAVKLGVTARRVEKLVKVEFAKVAEWQARGQIHFHAIIRLDAARSAEDGTPLPPPVNLTTYDLIAAVKEAVKKVPPPELIKPFGWGDKNEIRPISAERAPSGPVTDDQVAGYLAKYATKATEAITPGAVGNHETVYDLLDDPKVRSHIARMAKTALTLADLIGEEKLRRYATTLGYGGHFLTKSRRYSTTFTRLRRARIEHARGRVADAWDRPLDPELVEVVSTFEYVKSGYRTVQERELAVAAAARARERRRQRWAAKQAA